MNALKYGLLILLSLFITAFLFFIAPLAVYLLGQVVNCEETTQLGLTVWIFGVFLSQGILIPLCWWWAGQTKINRSLIVLSASILVLAALFYLIKGMK